MSYRFFHIWILLWFLPAMAMAQNPPQSPPMQGLGLMLPNQKSPIELSADNGMEWRREENLYILRGNALAQSGDLSVRADELRGYYRNTAQNQMELFKLEAIGQVTLQSGGQTARADQAFYDLDQQVFVLLGQTITLTTPTANLQAKDRIEYWQGKNLAVARVGAVATQGENRLRANNLVAHFAPGKANNRPELRRIEAEGSVKIQSKDNLAQSQKASYELATGQITMTGDVQLSQGGNQLTGAAAELNTQTGVSRILGSKDNSQGRQRVRALIIPKPATNTSSF